MASLDREVVREVLREELARALPGLATGSAVAQQAEAPTPPPAEEASPATPRSPEQKTALDTARKAVERALSQGNVTSAETRDLHDALEAIDADSRFQLSLRLAAAMNRQELKVEDRRLLF